MYLPIKDSYADGQTVLFHLTRRADQITTKLGDYAGAITSRGKAKSSRHAFSNRGIAAYRNHQPCSSSLAPFPMVVLRVAPLLEFRKGKEFHIAHDADSHKGERGQSASVQLKAPFLNDRDPRVSLISCFAGIL